MTVIGSPEQPLRVAIIGSGPAGFYAAESLFKRPELNVRVDMYDRLPTPFGLVRGGVAPDHQKIKSVTKAYTRIAANENFRFFGHVDFGADVTLEDLRRHYHQLIYCTGAQTDRNLGIPGEDLPGSHAATEFVAWYNGHPDYRDCAFDLSRERVAVIGVGNVAVDVCRVLCRTREELLQTDVADYALEALCASRVREVYMLGRRGPLQSAFTNPEIKELGEMAGADICIAPEDAALDELSRRALEQDPQTALKNKIEMLAGFARRPPAGKPKRLVLRFLVSPVEIRAGADGRVCGLRIVRNELYQPERGELRPRATERFEELECGLIFRSVGYRGVPLPGVPFHDAWGVIPNDKGRVLQAPGGTAVPGEYAAGWIKRGPTGVIGTNKSDAVETVDCMMEDLAAGRVPRPQAPDPDAVLQLLRQRKPDFVTFADWLRLDQLEIANGARCGRPRVKFTSCTEMLAALDRAAAN